MRLLIASVGSLGDALPYVRLGVALRARGHSVRIFTNTDHSALVREHGLELATPGEAVSSAQLAQNPLLWHPIRGMGVFWRGLLSPSIVPLYREIERMHAESAELRVLAGPHMMGARLAQVGLRVPLLSLYTSPNMLRTHIAPCSLAHLSFPGGTPRWVLKKAWRWIDANKLEPMARPALTHACELLSLRPPPSAESLFGQWMHSPQGGITLYPEWFAPIPADHTTPVTHGAFPIRPTQGPALGLDQDEALSRFLDAGEPPVVVMLGTAMTHAHQSYAAWAKALDAAGMRSVFLSAQADQLPSASAQRFIGRYAPFDRLLPRCAGLVHHGGIGSAIEALAAGVPQLIEARAHDQFENARCLAKLGAAQRLSADASVYQRLRALRRLGELAEANRHLPKDEGLDRLCARIEAHSALGPDTGWTMRL